MDTGTKIVGALLVAGVLYVGYNAYKDSQSRERAITDGDGVDRLPAGNSDDRNEGSTEERVASGLLGIGREITRGIFAKVERDDNARERQRERDAERQRSSDSDDYDPVADYERKRAA